MKNGLLTLLAAAVLAAPARAQQVSLEKLSANAGTSFHVKAGSLLTGSKKRGKREAGESGFVFLGPGSFGDEDDDATVTGVVLTQRDGRGGAGGVEIDIPINGLGTTGVVGLTGFGKLHPEGLNTAVSHSFVGGPSVGLRQRFFQVGIKGVTLVPNVSAGWAPFSVVRTFGPDTWDGKVAAHGVYAPMTGFVGAGIGVRVAEGVELCVETRCYSTFTNNQPSLKVTGVTIMLNPNSW